MNITNKHSFLIILFGTLDYDGRVKRMIEVLRKIGPITLVDLPADTKKNNSLFEKVNRISVCTPQQSGKFIRHLYFWFTSIRQALQTKPDVIVAEDYFTCLPAWIAAKLVRAKLAYDAHELIIPEAGKQMSLRNRFWYLLEKWVVKQADLVIAANENRAQLMAEHYGLNRIPEVMRNIPPRRNLQLGSVKALRAHPVLARKNQEDRLILYQGDVSLSRGLRRFVEALAFLPKCYRLVVAGGGPDLDKLSKIAENFSSEGRFAALGRIENQLLPNITALADVGIVCYPFIGLNNIYCAPNKLFEYAQAGLPVIATDQPTLRKAVETYKIGELVEEKTSTEEVALLLQKVVTNKNYYRQQLENFLDANCWEDEAERVRKAFGKIWSIAA